MCYESPQLDTAALEALRRGGGPETGWWRLCFGRTFASLPEECLTTSL